MSNSYWVSDSTYDMALKNPQIMVGALIDALEMVKKESKQ